MHPHHSGRHALHQTLRRLTAAVLEHHNGQLDDATVPLGAMASAAVRSAALHARFMSPDHLTYPADPCQVAPTMTVRRGEPTR